MNAIYLDAPLSDEQKRELLYRGQLLVYSPTPSSLALVNFARKMAEDAFHPHSPETAQFDFPVERYAAILSELKPKFIHAPESKKFIQGMLAELGFNLEKTYFDVPRMRSSTSDDYLKVGIAYAFHPHRDTWYSAPMCQINWWMPIYPIVPENAMAFHPHYWNHAVRNGSADYNYAEWNRTSRQNAAQFIKEDTRKQPKPEESMELDPQLRVIAPPGGVLLFSAAQMHSSVPNNSGKTRFSIDFRTVNIDDVAARRGAPNVDSACTGTTMGDYLRGTDLSHIPEKYFELYETQPPFATAAEFATAGAK
ncbi:MAG TPA: hypothetical protein VJP87_01565 [Candidatus Acidoferrales bacterium]|nr:hypothetical protein [Candidatus Acidoferrales bacterium]